MEGIDTRKVATSQLAGLGILSVLLSAVVSIVVLLLVRRRAPVPSSTENGSLERTPYPDVPIHGDSLFSSSPNGKAEEGVVGEVRASGNAADASAAQSQPLGQPRPAPAEQIPVQPAIDTSVPVDAPQHFSEDVVIPGFTETGADVEEEDVEEGRSPEGA